MVINSLYLTIVISKLSWYSIHSVKLEKAILRECGVHVVDSPAEIGKKVAEVLG